MTPERSATDHRRRGAALILALIILVMLMMLGVPFIMNQSYSLSGSVSFRARQEADNGRTSGESLGVGLGVDYNSEHFTDRDRLHSNIVEDLRQITGRHRAFSELDEFGRVHVHLDQLQLGLGDNGDDTLVGVSLEDESGKLDVNAMDSAAWEKLFKLLAINDWDDNGITDGQDRIRERGHYAGDTDDGDVYQVMDRTEFATWIDNTTIKGDMKYGQLAAALSAVRFDLPGEQIGSLKDLLKVRYGKLPYGSGSGGGLRPELSPQELELLRPFLTHHRTGQGRGGIVDLGTVIAMKPRPQGSHNPFLPLPVFDGDLRSTVGYGAVILGQELDQDGNFQLGYRSSYYPAIAAEGDNPRDLDVLDPIGVEVPSPVNLHTASQTVFATVAMDVDDVDKAPELRGKTYPDYMSLLGDSAPTTTWGLHDSPFDLLVPMWNKYRRESVPLSLRSWGLVRINAGATAIDQRDRPVAEAQRTMLVQAMPQEENVKLSWDDQMDLYILLGQRHGSQLVSWPQPRNRFRDVIPSTDPGEPDTGIRPGVLPTVARMWEIKERFERRGVNDAREHWIPPQFNLDWTRSFWGPEQTAIMMKGLSQGPPSKGGYTIEDLTPDGLPLGSDPVAYPVLPTSTVAPEDGQDPDLQPADGEPGNGPIKAVQRKSRRRNGGDFLPRAVHEIDGRHISFWFKPEQGWQGGSMLEIPTVADNQMPYWDGTKPSGPDYYQNVWRLSYVGSKNYLVLELANPAIEHRVPYGHEIPEDDPASIHWNEQSLGSDADSANEELAPAYPKLGSKTTFWYKVAGGFDADRWYHVHLVIAHERPGGQAIILDGLVGRDANSLDPDEQMMHGDHATFPALRLASELPSADIQNGGGGPLAEASIKLKGNNILKDLTGDANNLEAVLPKRGTILVGNEFISFETLNGDTLENCYRAVRANTNADWRWNPNPNWESPTRRYPKVELHPEDSLVVPGGFRYRPRPWSSRRRVTNPDGSTSWVIVWHYLRLYEGGGTLINNPLGNGDPRETSALVNSDGENRFRFRYWGQFSEQLGDYDALHQATDPDDGEIWVWFDRDTTEIVIQSDTERQYTTDIPEQGLLRIQSNYNWLVWYGSFDGSRFSNLRWLSQAETQAAGLGGGAPDGAQSNRWKVAPDEDPDRPPLLWLVNMEVQGDILGNRDFNNSLRLFQIEDPNTGRIEWIRYDNRSGIPTNTGTTTCFLNWDGWPLEDRGQQRTAFAGMYNEVGGTDTLDPVNDVFPMQSIILPIQRDVDAHFFVSGDNVTIMPDEIDIESGEPQKIPTQFLIRYAATDAYPDDPGLRPPDEETPWFRRDWDTVNEYFTFNKQLPHAYHWHAETSSTPNSQPFEFLSGTCWANEDLSMVGRASSSGGSSDSITLYHGMMPRLDGFGENYKLGTGIEFYICSDGKTQSPGEVSLDSLAAGPQFGRTVATGKQAEVRHFGSGNFILNEGDFNDVEIDTDINEIFSRHRRQGRYAKKASNTYFGLIMVDGEVMAYERGDGDPPKIFARGLLGTVSKEHEVVIDPLHGHVVDAPKVMHIPIGPVGRLRTGLSPGTIRTPIEIERFQANNGRGGKELESLFPECPAHLLCKRDGSAYEIAKLIMDTTNAARVDKSNNGNVTHSQYFYTAPWLRGLYNTMPQSFGADDVVIGWWPRYPSVLPNTSSPSWTMLSPEYQAAAIRSRTFAWASVAVRFKDCIFPANGAVELIGSDSGGGRFQLFARALDKSWKWNEATEFPGVAADACFQDQRFDKPVDGAEVKFFWRYAKPPVDGSATSGGQDRGARFFQDVGDGANRAPAIDGFRMQVRAPTLVLEQRGAR